MTDPTTSGNGSMGRTTQAIIKLNYSTNYTMPSSAEVIAKTIQDGKAPIAHYWEPASGELKRDKGTFVFHVSRKDMDQWLKQKTRCILLFMDIEEMNSMADILDAESQP